MAKKKGRSRARDPVPVSEARVRATAPRESPPRRPLIEPPGRPAAPAVAWPAPVPLPPAEPGAWKIRVAIALTLAAVTALSYRPVLDAGFLNWDDPAYASTNPNIRGLSWRTVTWAFTTFQEGIWHPLTWLSLALDYRLYGLEARGFHLTNLLLHVANTVLVFLGLQRLTGARWRSAAVAALFGLHPMHVESVAWVTERKDVLSTFFWLLTIGAYARWVRVNTFLASLAVLVAFLFGLLSKPMLVTLPFALLLLDYWPLRRLSWQTAVEKLPLLLVAVLVAGVGVAAVADVRASAIPDPIPTGALIANAIVSCVRYIELTVWPVDLSPWYSHPWFEGPPLGVAAVAGASLALVGVSALVVRVAGRFPYAPVGWFWYLGTLVPVLGLVYNGRQGMADRYAYIPHLGLFVVMVWAVADLPVWSSRPARAAGAATFAVLLSDLGVLTARQTRVWHDDQTFWTHTAKANPYSFIAHQALAILMQAEGRNDDAIRLYARATRIRPELPRVHVQFAKLLARAGHPGPAAAAYRKALAVDDSAEYRYGLAQVLLAQGRRPAGRRQLERALARRPGYPEARKSLAAMDPEPNVSAPAP